MNTIKKHPGNPQDLQQCSSHSALSLSLFGVYKIQSISPHDQSMLTKTFDRSCPREWISNSVAGSSRRICFMCKQLRPFAKPPPPPPSPLSHWLQGIGRFDRRCSLEKMYYLIDNAIYHTLWENTAGSFACFFAFVLCCFASISPFMLRLHVAAVHFISQVLFPCGSYAFVFYTL